MLTGRERRASPRRQLEIPQVLEVRFHAAAITRAPLGEDRKRILHLRIAQTGSVEAGLLAHLARGRFGRRLAPTQRARHRLPETRGPHALEQQAVELARMDHHQYGLRALELA